MPCDNLHMPELTPEERWDRTEKVLESLAEGRVSLQKLIEQLATDTRNAFDRLAKQAEKRDRPAN